MSFVLDNRFIYIRRRVVALVVIAAMLVSGALLASSSLAGPSTVHSHVAGDGTVVVSGYDGGAALKP